MKRILYTSIKIPRLLAQPGLFEIGGGISSPYGKGGWRVVQFYIGLTSLSGQMPQSWSASNAVRTRTAVF